MSIILIFILGILVFFYLLDFIVQHLNIRSIQLELPQEFIGFYDPEKYALSQKYLKENTRFHSMESTFDVILSIGFIILGGFSILDVWVRGFGFGEVTTGIFYIGTLAVLSSIISIPFDIYSTFVIEEKYGFNKTTWKVFLADRLKGFLLAAILGGGALALILWFFENFANAWLYAWGALTVLQIILLFLAPAIIMPLFNRFEPLATGELKGAIEDFAKREGFQMEGVFTMDGSKRSTKANAFFTGFGKFRRIVLFDTLVAKHSVKELVAVLAHEIGHYKLRHIIKMLVVSFFSTGLLFYTCSLLLKNEMVFQAFQMSHLSTYASLVFITMIYSPLSKVLGVCSSYLSRKHEFEADAYAARATGESENLISALKKLSVENLSNLSPHSWKVFLEYSHPPVLERIKALRGI